MNAEEIKKLVLSTRPHGELNIGKKTLGLGKSLVQWAKNGFSRVDQSVYEKRLSVCRICEHWIESGNAGFGKCRICGCGRGKLWLPHEKCPIDKWGSEPLTPLASV